MRTRVESLWWLLPGGLILLLSTELAMLAGVRSPWVLWGLLTLTAGWCGAIGHALWRTARERRLRDQLLQVGRELSALRDGGQLLDRLVEAIAKLLPRADKCVVHLLDEAGQRLFPRYAATPDPAMPLGSSPSAAATVGMPADRGIAGQALREHRAISVPDVRSAPSFLPLSSGSDLRALLVAPLYVHERPLGTISLNSRLPRAFGERDAYIVSTLAGFAANAFHQIRLLSEGQYENRYLGAMVDVLPDGLLILDASGRIVRHNIALARMLGLGAGDLAGCLVSAQSEDERLQRLARLVAQLPPGADERVVLLDEPMPARLRLSRTAWANGGLGGCQVFMVHDETALQELRNACGALAIAAAREMAAWLVKLQSIDPIGSPREHRAALMHLARLAANLSDPCLQECGGETLALQEVDVSALVLDVYRRFGELADTSSGVLRIQSRFERTTMLDSERMSRALLSLLANALHRAGPECEMTLMTRAQGSELIIELTDNGQPIPPHERQRIWRSTLLADGAQAGGAAGTGLDLYACKRIAEAHGGQMWMPDAPAGLNRFSIMLPLISPAASAAHLAARTS